MTIGSSTNLAGGTTITGVSLAGGVYTLTLSQPATTTAAGNATLVFNALSNGYTGDTVTQGGSLSTTGGTLNLSGQAGSIVVRGNLIINNSTVTMNANQGQIAATSNVSLFGGGVLNLVGTNTLHNLAFTNGGAIVNPTVNAGTMLILTDLTGISADQRQHGHHADSRGHRGELREPRRHHHHHLGRFGGFADHLSRHHLGRRDHQGWHRLARSPERERGEPHLEPCRGIADPEQRDRSRRECRQPAEPYRRRHVARRHGGAHHRDPDQDSPRAAASPSAEPRAPTSST